MRAFLIPCLLVASIVTVFIAISCNKTNGGKATLSLESISTPVFPNDSCRIRFKFTGGSSISNGTIWLIRRRINQLPADNPSGGDTVNYQLPSFSANTGEIYWSIPWSGYLSETSTQNDSDFFRFWVQDGKDTLTTDTVNSPQVIVLFQ
jgi:hypothetical protein